MKSSRTLIVHPSTLYDPYWGPIYTVKPQLAGLFSHLHRNGLAAEIIDFEVENGRPKTDQERRTFLRAVRRRLAAQTFDVLAISCYTSLQYLSSIEVANIAREIHPNAVIVVGGHHPMAVPGDFSYPESPFDYIVQGEGEQALLDLSRDPVRPDAPRVLRGTQLPLRRDTLPLWGHYPYRKEKSLIPTFLSRGCPFTCKFCMEPSRPFSGWRSLTVDDAIHETLALAKAFKPAQIKFSDAIFGFKKSWRREFLPRLAKLKTGAAYWMETRADILDSEDLAQLQQIDTIISLGIETGSEEMIRNMGKAESPRQYLDRCRSVIEELNDRGISFRLFAIFNHPGETRQTAQESIEFFRSLVEGQKTFCGTISAQNYHFYPGTEIETTLSSLNKNHGTVIEHPQWWKNPCDHFPLSTDVSAGRDNLSIANDDSNFWMADIKKILATIHTKMPKKNKLFFALEALITRDMLIRPKTQWWQNPRTSKKRSAEAPSAV